MRAGLKKIVPVTMWPFFRSVDKYIVGGLYVWFALRRICALGTVRHIHPLSQSIPSVKSYVNLGQTTSADCLVECFKKEGIQYKSGRHSVYLDRDEDIARINPTIQNRYPHLCGLKILKGRQLSSDGTPYYTSSELAPASTWFSMYSVGSILDKVVISNLLHQAAVAPVVFDVIKLESEDGGWQFALIVQHISGPVVTGEEGIKFIVDFKRALTRFGLKTISIKEHSDLRPPEFRHNIIKNSQKTYYVDIQNFVMLRRNFPNEVFKTGCKGCSAESACSFWDYFVELSRKRRRNSDLIEQDSKSLTVFFDQHDVALEHSVIIDKSVGVSFFVMYCLHQGVGWCVLERAKEEAQKVYYMMILLGYSRFDLVSSAEEVAHFLNNKKSLGQEVVFVCAKNLPARNQWAGLGLHESLIIESERSATEEFELLPPQLFEDKTHVGSFDFVSQSGAGVQWHLYKRTMASSLTTNDS